MPIYEYKCENGHVFDIMQKMSEARLESCVECGAPVKKLMHPVNISFKGSGFYSTDYKGKKTEKTDGAKSTATETSGSPEANGGSESKPESNGAKSSEGFSTEKKVAKKD